MMEPYFIGVNKQAMQVKKQLETLLSKQLSRKEFLQYIGLALMTIGGVSTLLRLIERDTAATSRSEGYGSSAYGGSEDGQ